MPPASPLQVPSDAACRAATTPPIFASRRRYIAMPPLPPLRRHSERLNFQRRMEAAFAAILPAFAMLSAPLAGDAAFAIRRCQRCFAYFSAADEA